MTFLHRPQWVWACTLLLLVLLASAPAVTRLAVTRTLTVHDLVLMRCVIGGLVMLPILIAQRRAIPRSLWIFGLVLACCHGWGMHLAAIAGLQFAPAAHGSALGPGFIPVWVALWTWVFYRGLPTRPQFTGLLLIAAGALILLANSRAADFAPRMLLGDLFFLLSSALAGVYLTYVQRHQVPALQAGALVAVYSAVVYLPWFVIAPVQSGLALASWTEIFWQSLYQGLGVGALFTVMINFVVLRLGGQRFSILAASVPVLALLFGRWIAGDGISVVECVAIAFISGGVLYGALIRRPMVTESASAALRT
jgi:drug/metabolite transporter (DMT)-like permease